MYACYFQAARTVQRRWSKMISECSAVHSPRVQFLRESIYIGETRRKFQRANASFRLAVARRPSRDGAFNSFRWNCRSITAPFVASENCCLAPFPPLPRPLLPRGKNFGELSKHVIAIIASEVLVIRLVHCIYALVYNCSARAFNSDVYIALSGIALDGTFSSIVQLFRLGIILFGEQFSFSFFKHFIFFYAGYILRRFPAPASYNKGWLESGLSLCLKNVPSRQKRSPPRRHQGALHVPPSVQLGSGDFFALGRGGEGERGDRLISGCLIPSLCARMTCKEWNPREHLGSAPWQRIAISARSASSRSFCAPRSRRVNRREAKSSSSRDKGDREMHTRFSYIAAPSA